MSGDTADSYVSSVSPTVNYGGRTVLRAEHGAGTRNAYLRFTVAGTGGSVASAVLRVYSRSRSGSHGLDAHRAASNSWSETGIIWPNAPGFGSTIGSSAAFAGNVWVDIDVTSSVRGDGGFSFVLTTGDTVTISLASREDPTHAPLLTTTAASTPTPLPTSTPVPPCTPSPTASPTPTPTPTPTPPVPSPQTTWRAAGAPPLSDVQASALVTHVAENRSDNTTSNQYLPTDAQLASFHAALDSYGEPESRFEQERQYVTGHPGLAHPSTDDLIQWAAHKWGIPEDWIRAEMVTESNWHMSQLGDRITVASAWYRQYPAQARVPNTLDVFRSMGVMQIGWKPDGSLLEGVGAEPLRWQSTAFNLDEYGATIRWLYEGHCSWCTSGYGAGQDWASIGAWFAPYPWNGAAAQSYIANVQSNLANRPWATPGF